MKTVLAVAATALIMGASSTFATTQFIDRGARTQAAAALKQAKQAKASIRALNVRVQDREIFDACMGNVVGVSQYPNYVGFDGVNYYTTTALDTAATPQAWLQVVDPGCITTTQGFTPFGVGPGKAMWLRHARKAFGR